MFWTRCYLILYFSIIEYDLLYQYGSRMLFSSLFYLSSAFSKPIAPDPRGMAGPDRNFDLQTLHLDLTLEPDKQRVSGMARLGVQRLFEGPFLIELAQGTGGNRKTQNTKRLLFVFSLGDPEHRAPRAI